jgi:hypothetical protein
MLSGLILDARRLPVNQHRYGIPSLAAAVLMFRAALALCSLVQHLSQDPAGRAECTGQQHDADRQAGAHDAGSVPDRAGARGAGVAGTVPTVVSLPMGMPIIGVTQIISKLFRGAALPTALTMIAALAIDTTRVRE